MDTRYLIAYESGTRDLTMGAKLWLNERLQTLDATW
ncbi:hypothetical protein SOVF_167060 [Spinacia oleracea]|nr:hypothetical protein SOVF_167060 [Spinacia oleracea]